MLARRASSGSASRPRRRKVRAAIVITDACGRPRRSAAITAPKSVSSQTTASGRHFVQTSRSAAACSRASRSAKPWRKSRRSRSMSTGCSGIRRRGVVRGGSVAKTVTPRTASGSSAARPSGVRDRVAGRRGGIPERDERVEVTGAPDEGQEDAHAGARGLAPGDLRVGRPQHHVDEQPDERDDEHDDRPGGLGGARQVGAAEDVHRRAHPKDEEDRDCGDEEDPDHVLPSLTLLRDGPTLVVMDAFALDELELPPILERVAAAATTEQGAELARALAPSPDPAEVAHRQALTAEAIALLDESLEPELRGIHDVRGAAALAARGGVLTAGALRQVADTVEGSLRVRGSVETPLLSELAAAIDPGLKPLGEAIGRAVEEDGSDVRDNASPRLRKLRAELRNGRHRVTEGSSSSSARAAGASICRRTS